MSRFFLTESSWTHFGRASTGVSWNPRSRRVTRTVDIPVATAQQLFNRDELTEIHVQFATSAGVASVSEGITKALKARHRGEEDFTLISQTDMLRVFNRILGIVSVGVTAIGGISLVIGAIGILTMMWISVNERTAEIGVARALGATPQQVLRLFLIEASLLSLAGGALGVATGMGVARALQLALPGLPVHTRPGYVAASLAMSLAVGLVSGVLPAARCRARSGRGASGGIRQGVILRKTSLSLSCSATGRTT
jgi:putative ABC transport system permease protein